ncbi:hypothetical protein [Propionivibrio sp.]|uniref:hypothetical protein n=1 Tax=Propionivibrio sp. TaxID=2212460 RepID=UPI003BF435E6
MNSWHQYAVGHLADGSRVMLVQVCGDFKRSRRFVALLICLADGLHRLWRDGRSQLLAPGYVWPQTQEPNAEYSLRPHVPKYWGKQHGSTTVVQELPHWLLRSNTNNLARLLIAWYRANHAVFVERVKRIDIALRPWPVLPDSPTWSPVAITLVPNTDVVVRAVHSGVLLRRLKLGLERIYISEMASIRAPSIKVTLLALAHRFAERLVLVKALAYEQCCVALRMTRVSACEYQFIGQQLQDRFETDYTQNPIQTMLRMRIGDVPRGVKVLWMNQLQVDFEVWDGLDVNGMLEMEKVAHERRNEKSRRAVAALRNVRGTGQN